MKFKVSRQQGTDAVRVDILAEEFDFTFYMFPEERQELIDALRASESQEERVK